MISGPAGRRPAGGSAGGVSVSASDRLGVRDAWHLLRRAGFGAHESEVAQYAALSRAAAVDQLLAAPPESAEGPGTYTASPKALEQLQVWWLRRMATPRLRLQEKMTLFWHDHFPSAADVINRFEALTEQNAMFRLRGLGSFRALLRHVTRNRAMLQYLDGAENRVGAVNENYARELMELFTLGPNDDQGAPNYQQLDVAGLARALTGFTYDTGAEPLVRMSPVRFDASSKRLFIGRPFQRAGNLGVEGFDGRPFEHATNVLAAMFSHRDSLGRPTLARFLVRKLWRWFAAPEIDEAVLYELAGVFVRSNYSVRALVRALLQHDAFYSEAARRLTTKTPVDFAIQAVLALGAQTDWLTAPSFLRRMGMSLFDPPGVEGWPDGAAWLSASRYLARIELAQSLASGRSTSDGFRFAPAAPRGATPASLVDVALRQLGLEVSASVRQGLIGYVSGGSPGTTSWYEMKVRGLYVLLLSLPEFQVH
jgi:uncharacterized protein (DUF1800 family)